MELYHTLFRLRKETPPLTRPDRNRLEVQAAEDSRVLRVRQWTERVEVCCLFNFGDADADAPVPDRVFEAGNSGQRGRWGTWEKLLDSADARWDGPGSASPERVRAHSFAVYRSSRQEPADPPA